MEDQKEYQRIEREKFELIQFSCPWRVTPKIKGQVFCLASTEICQADGCGIWHVVKAMAG